MPAAQQNYSLCQSQEGMVQDSLALKELQCGMVDQRAKTDDDDGALHTTFTAKGVDLLTRSQTYS